ncbi:MAG: hypothetical protein ACK4J0_01470 [Candidatus Anstonellaceae archaeon]
MPLKFDFENSSVSYPKNFEKFDDYTNYLKEILQKKTYDCPESFILLPYEKQFLEQTKKILHSIKPDLLILIGIGGSNLGAWAVYEAVFGRYAILQNKKILFADVPDPSLLNQILFFSSLYQKQKKKVCLVFISKSGSTLESVANFKALYLHLKKKAKNLDILFISNQNVFNPIELEKLNIYSLQIPQQVVGRYSVFSSVGLFPLLFSEVNAKKLLDGAKFAIENFLGRNKEDLYKTSYFIYNHYSSKKNIFINFCFSSSLDKYGQWHNQLLAESLSKNSKGLTPYYSSAPADLHSLAQLYFGGPKDKFFSFLSIKNFKFDFKFFQNFGIFKEEDILKNKSIFSVYNSIFNGVKNSFKNSKIPFISLELDFLDEFHIGYLMQFDMLKTIFCSKLFEVNPFNQPEVELYKKEIKKLL